MGARYPNRNLNGSRKPAPSGFSIGEAAAIIGVSTHVLRSWERRLSLDLNNRTPSNQRRYGIDDIHRLMRIRHLHEKAGLPLVESAARALAKNHPPPDARYGLGGAGIDQFWAGLLDTLPEVLIVIDERGRVTAANAVARAKLGVRTGGTFSSLAPVGWRQVYSAIRSARGRGEPRLLAMRARSGTIVMEARVESVGAPDGPVVLIGRRLRAQALTEGAPTHAVAVNG